MRARDALCRYPTRFEPKRCAPQPPPRCDATKARAREGAHAGGRRVVLRLRSRRASCAVIQGESEKSSSGPTLHLRRRGLGTWRGPHTRDGSGTDAPPPRVDPTRPMCSDGTREHARACSGAQWQARVPEISRALLRVARSTSSVAVGGPTRHEI
eukprot:5444447-Prymnesium_polylepis.1